MCFYSRIVDLDQFTYILLEEVLKLFLFLLSLNRFRDLPNRDGNPRTNFDNFWNAALAVFQVRILDSWNQLMSVLSVILVAMQFRSFDL